MPSHDIHRLLASKYLGLSEDMVNVIDKIIDLGSIHDVGRRVPRAVPKYLDVLESGDVEKLIVSERWKNVSKLLNRVLSCEVHVKAFYFHHALDLLALRLASVLILELDEERLHRNIVEGTLLDLQSVELNLRRMGIHTSLHLEDIRGELKKALIDSCLDKALVEWVQNNVIPDLKRYQSLDYIKARYIEKVQKIVEADAKYELGLELGIVAHTYRRECARIEVLVGNKEFSTLHLRRGEKISRHEVDNEYRRLLQEKQDLRKLSPYARGLLRRAMVRLAALYSKLYYLPFTRPLPLSLAFEDLLSVRKRKYSVARDLLKCYSIHKGSPHVRECVEQALSRVSTSYAEILDPRKLENIMEKFVEALDKLLTLSLSMGIDVLMDI